MKKDDRLQMELTTTQNDSLDPVGSIGSQIDYLRSRLPDLPTEEVVDIFCGINTLQKMTKDFEGDVRAAVDSRRDSAGVDSSGNFLFAGKNSTGLKLVRRVSLNVKPGIMEQLRDDDPDLYHELSAMLPRRFNEEKARAIFQHYDIPEEEYSDPDFSVSSLEALVEQGSLAAETVLGLLDSKESWAFTTVKEKKNGSKG